MEMEFKKKTPLVRFKLIRIRREVIKIRDKLIFLVIENWLNFLRNYFLKFD